MLVLITTAFVLLERSVLQVRDGERDCTVNFTGTLPVYCRV